MREMNIIFWREIRQYATSPLAYIMAFAFLLLTGITFNNELTLSISRRAVDPALIPNLLTLIMILLAPLLTMRLLAEESREGTMELLLTAPVPDFAIVIGKFLSAWAYFSLLLMLTLLYQVILSQYTQPDLVHTIGAYVGIWLYGGATLAVGVAFSALTDNQLFAAFLSSITLLILYFGESVGQIVASTELATIIFNLTLRGHFTPSFAVGVVRGEDFIYYAAVIVVMLFIAIQLVQARRWR